MSVMRGESMRCRKGQQAIPFLYSRCSWEFSRVCGRGSAAVVRQEGVRRSQWQPVWQGMTSSRKPLEVLQVYLVYALAVELAQWEARDQQSEPCSFGMPGWGARHGWCALLKRRESSWRSVMFGLHWSVQLVLYSCSGLKKTPVLQGARAMLHSVVVLYASHYSESFGAFRGPWNLDPAALGTA